jgi:phage-related baseplate assembly protein
MATPLDTLPDISFCVRDATIISNNIINGFEAASAADGFPISLAPGDKRRLFLLDISALITQERVQADWIGKQVLLKYATGTSLDALGAYWGDRGFRLAASFAVTTLQFSIPSAIGSNITIPVGTQVSAAPGVAFATDTVAIIIAGQTSITVSATATVAGTVCNDYVSGQINKIVNWNTSYAVTATNTTTTSGGYDAEDDEHYRTRLYLIPATFTTCGAIDSYKFWAYTANPGIIDVSVWSTESVTGLLADGGKVQIAILMSGGALPSAGIISATLAVVSARDKRPLTDVVTVQAPTTVSYNVNVTYYVDNANSANVNNINTAVSQAVSDWKTYTNTAIGRDINPSDLIRRMVDAGAKRVTVTSPSFTTVSSSQVAVTGTTTVNFGGLEDA